MRNNLRDFRINLGLTQEEFSELFNKERQYQNNIEKGKRKGSAEYWLHIQKKFRLSNEETLNLMEVVQDEKA